MPHTLTQLNDAIEASVGQPQAGLISLLVGDLLERTIESAFRGGYDSARRGLPEDDAFVEVRTRVRLELRPAPEPVNP
jgi:hypothetical protein